MQKPLGALIPSSHSYLDGFIVLFIFFLKAGREQELEGTQALPVGGEALTAGGKYGAQGGLFLQTCYRAGRNMTVRKMGWGWRPLNCAVHNLNKRTGQTREHGSGSVRWLSTRGYKTQSSRRALLRGTLMASEERLACQNPESTSIQMESAL